VERIANMRRGGFGRPFSSSLVAAGLCAIALALPGGPAAAAPGKYSLTSHMAGTTSKVRATRATGAFRGSLKLAAQDSSFTWTLTFRRLSGRALHAGIYFGKAGKPSQLAMLLCNKCSSGAQSYYQGSYVASPSFVRTILRGHAYVIIQTKRHPNGEIRGRIKASTA
jgi:CHRD domain-containing protein